MKFNDLIVKFRQLPDEKQIALGMIFLGIVLILVAVVLLL